MEPGRACLAAHELAEAQRNWNQKVMENNEQWRPKEDRAEHIGPKAKVNDLLGVTGIIRGF